MQRFHTFISYFHFVNWRVSFAPNGVYIFSISIPTDYHKIAETSRELWFVAFYANMTYNGKYLPLYLFIFLFCLKSLYSDLCVVIRGLPSGDKKRL